MRKPVVDYREFRLSKLNDPHFSHLLLLLGWVVYFGLYFLTENLIPAENCHPIHCKLDDIIPFCEYFIIPYAGWYLLIVFSLGYFALYNVENFRRLQIFIMVTQALAMVVYIVYPSCQELRPAEFPRENVFSWLLGLIYQFDTNTGVLPSLHCAYSIGIASVWLKEKSVKPWFRAFIVVFCLLVCVSTAFVKQHSVLDFFAALPVCLAAEIIACGNWWKEKYKLIRT